jgi:hypothetical protein
LFSNVYLYCIEQMVLPSGHHLGGLLEDALEQGKPIYGQPTHCKQFPFMYSQKRFSQDSLLISTKYFHILERSTKIYSAVSIGNNIFPNIIMKFQKYRSFIYPDRNLEDFPLNLLFPLIKYIFWIWDPGLAISLLDQVMQISIKEMNFPIFIFLAIKSSSHLCNQTFPIIKNLFSKNS